MRDEQLHLWKHSHAFGQDRKRPGENRTLIVIAVTAVMMVVEITAGLMFGSMALLADGLHMASHTVALGINAFAYIYARRNAHDERFSFGTGKVNALGGFTGAILLVGFALVMIWESTERFISPVPIRYNEAIIVAFLGLLVNGASVLILGVHSHVHHDHGGEHEHGHGHDHSDHDHHHHDHNLVSAYLHVLADAVTSLFAIFALLAAKYFGFIWADPMMGIVGAALVTKWSIGLLRSTTQVLLDHEGPEKIRSAIMDSLEEPGETRVVDLHVWSVGPSVYAALISLVARNPLPPSYYKDKIPPEIVIDHVTVEVHPFDDPTPVDSHHHK